MGNPASAGPQERGEIHEDTMGTRGIDEREIGTRKQNGQCATLVRSHEEDEEEE